MAQGDGILQSSKEFEIIAQLDEALGMRELRAKVVSKAGFKAKKWDHFPCRFSINRDLCYHPKSIEVVRAYMDSGVLSDHIYDYFEKGDRCWGDDDVQRYIILVACAMTVGCTIPERVLEKMESMQSPAFVKDLKQTDPSCALKPLANAQLKKALAEYQADKPYDFGNTTMLEASYLHMFPGTTKVKNVDNLKLVEITEKDGRLIGSYIEPPTDEDIYLKPVYHYQLCAKCGKAEKKAGGELLACGGCHERKYCSKECQKSHWKMHKIICARPADQMAKFMASIEPLDFGAGPSMKDKLDSFPDDIKKMHLPYQHLPSFGTAA